MTAVVAGETLRIEARVASGGARPFVVLHSRERGEDAYRDVVMPRVGIDNYLRELPTEAGVETTIEYWIEASADGTTARAGSAEAPIVAVLASTAVTPSVSASDTPAPTPVGRSVTGLTAALKFGQTSVSEFDEDDLLEDVETEGTPAFGVNLSYGFTPSLAIELEYVQGGTDASFTFDSVDGSTTFSFEDEIEIESIALYGAYRSAGALYFAARLGYLREDIDGRKRRVGV